MVTSNTRKTHPTIPYTDQSLFESVSEASQRAQQLDRGILVSFSQSIKRFDAILVLQNIQQHTSEEYFFWEQPTKRSAIVGCGVAEIIETWGEKCATSTLAIWRQLLKHAVLTDSLDKPTDILAAPLLFGGFSFDIHTPNTSLWEGFPDGLLILPQTLFRQDAQHATCIVNAIVKPEDDIDACVQNMTQCLLQIHTLMEKGPSEKIQAKDNVAPQIIFHNVRPADDWKDLVAHSVQQIQQGVYEKVVLARMVKATVTHGELEVSRILARLRQSYPNSSIFALQRGESCFIGATPEQLISIGDGKFQTMALAGTAPRGSNDTEDLAIGNQLLQSKKNKGEHDIVVSRIKQILNNLYQDIWISDEPHLLKLKNVQHLITPIAGELLPDYNLLEVVEKLHPTPAVAGLPLQPALQAIRDSEQLDRGWYAGPLGWVDALGNGEFVVALRSALLKKHEAMLFAGCGIVADSDPQAEYSESCLKLEVMQRNLGQDNTSIEIHDTPRENIAQINPPHTYIPDAPRENTKPTNTPRENIKPINTPRENIKPINTPHTYIPDAPRENINLINPTYTYTQAFVDELQRAQMHNVVICPGSRSTPLAITFAEAKAIRVWMHVDERSAAFFALGMAKKLQQPIALICTSGTAAANFLPAIVEARQAHIPLLVITADRPPELRDCGAPQSIDQNRIYGSFVKWYSELALPEATNTMLQYVRTVAQRAVATAQAIPAGPIHLNIPFREPLVPKPSQDDVFIAPEARRQQAWHGRSNHQAYVSISNPLPGLPSDSKRMQLLQEMCRARHGLIIVGQQTQSTLAAALLPLAQRLNFPILADPLSQLRSGKDALILSSYDAFLRFPHVVNHMEPDFILRIGAMPTSKPVLQYLQYHTSCPQVVIDGDMSWEDPTQLISELIHTDPAAFCQQLQSSLESLNINPTLSETGWSGMWQHLDQSTQRALKTAIAAFTEPFEGRVFTELSALLPAEANLYVGNSMPIRDLDTFFWSRESAIHILGNRGANGIDGMISSALGASAVTPQDKPTVLVIGDLSFFHDLNGLLAASMHHLNLTIVLINNDGGGIFSFLPQAQYPEHFEQLFGVPIGLDFQHAGPLYGGQFHSVANWEQFRTHIHQGITTGGLHIIEVRTERESNVSMHRHLWTLVEQEINHQNIISFDNLPLD